MTDNQSEWLVLGLMILVFAWLLWRAKYRPDSFPDPKPHPCNRGPTTYVVDLKLVVKDDARKTLAEAIEPERCALEFHPETTLTPLGERVKP